MRVVVFYYGGVRVVSYVFVYGVECLFVDWFGVYDKVLKFWIECIGLYDVCVYDLCG